MGDQNTLESEDLSEYELVVSDEFGPETRRCFEHLTSRVIGQDRAARKIARSLSVHYSGLGEPGKPIGAFLCSGPTGWGKTFCAEELGRLLIADIPRAPISRIQCGKAKESHRVSEIIGSPPGYVGFDKPAKLSQFKIDEAHFWVKVQPFLKDAFEEAGPDADPDEVIEELYQAHKPYFSVVLFDEIEKAHPDIHNALLHIIDDGELELGNGTVTSFANTVIFLTCNIGGREQQEMLSGRTKRMGFSEGGARKEREMSEDESDALDQDIYRMTIERIEQIFAPELVARLSEDIVVFRTLSRLQQRTVLDNMLKGVQERFSGRADAKGEASRVPVAIVKFSERYKEFLLDEGISKKRGLRKLKAAMKRLTIAPLSNAVEAKSIVSGDEVIVDVADGTTVIRRKRGKAIMLPPPIAVGNGKDKK